MRALRVAVGLLPHSAVKLWLLRHLLGWRIGPGCYVAPIIADVRHASLGRGARIGAGNVFRNLETLTMGAGAHIGHWNQITAAPGFSGAPGNCSLTMDVEAGITSAHYLDCSGSITIGTYAVIGGRRCTLLTHQADYVNEWVVAEPIRIGDYTLIQSNVCVTPGRTIAARAIVAMGAVVAKDLLSEAMLYAGVPAVPKKPVHGGWFTRTAGHWPARAGVGR
ncbi:MAG: hypothetical protein JOZ75_09760 [Candidatus Dormibacteraeota bacterium]|nr:hypothetical protein [Candidatus Dormibacteraeota bacterium]